MFLALTITNSFSQTDLIKARNDILLDDVEDFETIVFKMATYEVSGESETLATISRNYYGYEEFQVLLRNYNLDVNIQDYLPKGTKISIPNPALCVLYFPLSCLQYFYSTTEMEKGLQIISPPSSKEPIKLEGHGRKLAWGNFFDFFAAITSIVLGVVSGPPDGVPTLTIELENNTGATFTKPVQLYTPDWERYSCNFPLDIPNGKTVTIYCSTHYRKNLDISFAYTFPGNLKFNFEMKVGIDKTNSITVLGKTSGCCKTVSVPVVKQGTTFQVKYFMSSGMEAFARISISV